MPSTAWGSKKPDPTSTGWTLPRCTGGTDSSAGGTQYGPGVPTERPAPAADDRPDPGSARRPPEPTRAGILALALPALGALVAPPLFLLVDAAIVGTLGTESLAALGIASQVVATIIGLCVFLAYGTTADVSRRLGAGNMSGALADGMAGMALGLLLGSAIAVATWLWGPELVEALGARGDVASQAVTYLNIVAVCFPMLLAATAGVGVLRGLQDTRTTFVVTSVTVAINAVICAVLVLRAGRGIGGSALATAIAETLAASAYFVVTIRRARGLGVSLRPDAFAVLRAARSGLALFVRTIALRGVYLLALVVATREGAQELAAYHVSYTVFLLCALALDALAIAGQALTGQYLGATDVTSARRTTAMTTRYGVVVGVWIGIAIALLSPWLPALFSDDPQVRLLTTGALLVVAVNQPLAGFVFVLDGILIGAGDARFLAVAQVFALVAFIPLAWWVARSEGGVVALWGALTVFMVVRGVAFGRRIAGHRWLVVGDVG